MPPGLAAGAALDVFHGYFPIGNLEAYDIVVLDRSTHQELRKPDDYEQGTGGGGTMIYIATSRLFRRYMPKGGLTTFSSVARRAAADAALLNHDFGDLVVADQGGWECSQPGLESTRTLFFENPVGGGTLKGQFTVVFESANSNQVREAHGILNGDVVGQVSVIAPTDFSR